jgi:hypothetical protein
MNLRFHFTLVAAFGLLACPALRADGFGPAPDLAVYLSPDDTTPVFQRLKPDDARLPGAAPVLDTVKAALGWETFDVPGPFPGFVPTDKSRTDLSVTPGTPIHLAADAASPVLGNASDNPALTLTSAGVDWSQVNFPGPVKVYFIKPAVKPVAAPPTPAPAPASASAPAPAPAPVAVATAIPAPAPVPAPVSVVAPVTAVTPPLKVTAIPGPAQAPAADLPHYYYGTLKLRTDTKISGPINAQYVLYSAKGLVIALVDLNDVVLASPVAALLGQSVKVYGTTYTGLSSSTVVIHGLTLQTN